MQQMCVCMEGGEVMKRVSESVLGRLVCGLQNEEGDKYRAILMIMFYCSARTNTTIHISCIYVLYMHTHH